MTEHIPENLDEIKGIENSTGWISSIVRDLCDIPEHLTKDAYLSLCKATADILLVASSDYLTIDQTDENGTASEAAERIRTIWLGVNARMGAANG